MDLKNLFKNDYVRLAIFAVLAYLAYRTFFVLREGVDNQGPGGGMDGGNIVSSALGFLIGPHWGCHGTGICPHSS